MVILYMGILLLFISFGLVIFTIVSLICSLNINYTFLFLSLIMTILFGIVLLALGIMSMYLAQIHLEVKRRPLYIIRESNTEGFNYEKLQIESNIQDFGPGSHLSTQY